MGNPDRGDDALGPVFVRDVAIRLPGHVSCLIHERDGAGLLELWQPEDHVIIVDCVRAGIAAGTLHRLDARAGRIPTDFFHYSSHAFGLAEAVEVARALDCLPTSLLILGIEGASYNLGAGLSEDVREALPHLECLLLKELGPHDKSNATNIPVSHA